MLCSTKLCNTAWEPGLVGVLVNKRCCHVKRTFKDKQLAFRVRLLTLQIFTSGGHPQQTSTPQKCTCAFLISHHLENAGTHKSSATNSKFSCISLLVSPWTQGKALVNSKAATRLAWCGWCFVPQGTHLIMLHTMPNLSHVWDPNRLSSRSTLSPIVWPLDPHIQKWFNV